MARRVVPSVVLVLLVGTVALAGCGSSGGGSSARTPTQKAEAAVERAQSDLDDANDDFAASSEAFCADAGDLIEVVDRYGQALQAERVTVGEVQTGADDIESGQEASEAAAEEAVADHGAVLDAQAALSAAQVDLVNAQAAESAACASSTAA